MDKMFKVSNTILLKLLFGKNNAESSTSCAHNICPQFIFIFSLLLVYKNEGSCCSVGNLATGTWEM